jgi:hypothetical protein
MCRAAPHAGRRSAGGRGGTHRVRRIGDKFVRGVPANEAGLIRVLRDDRDEENRGAAAFLLAHLRDGDKLVALMLAALDDPSSLVRNNAARVLWDVATWHPDIAIPLDPVLRRLDGPSTSDRNKTVLVIESLLWRPDGAALHRPVLRRAGQTLLKLLALEQPNNHDPAYRVLKLTSGQDFGERDLARWRSWLDQLH